jgi:hypothetical protein
MTFKEIREIELPSLELELMSAKEQQLEQALLMAFSTIFSAVLILLWTISHTPCALSPFRNLNLSKVIEFMVPEALFSFIAFVVGSL